MKTLLTAVALLAELTTWAAAHEAPTGWKYDPSCCAAMDCEQVEDGSVKATDAGWAIAATGEVIPYGDKRLKVSGDEHFHRCRMIFVNPLSKTRCLYVPPQSS